MWKNWKLRAMHFVTVWLVKNLLKAVHEDELLTTTSRGWYVGSRRLRPDEISLLKQEARELKGSYLWRLMSRDIKYIAYLRATNKARTSEDLLYSNAMYYNLELLETFISKCDESL